MIELKEKQNEINSGRFKRDDACFIILIDLGNTMICLNMEIAIVVYLIVEKLGAKYLNGNSPLLENLEFTLFKQFENRAKEREMA